MSLAGSRTKLGHKMVLKGSFGSSRLLMEIWGLLGLLLCPLHQNPERIQG